MHSTKAFACLPLFALTPLWSTGLSAQGQIETLDLLGADLEAAAVVSAGGSDTSILTDQESGYLGIGYEVTDKGVAVSEVIDGTAAERAGLELGDLVVSAGDKKVTEPSDLIDALGATGAGGSLVLGVQRGDKTLELKVTLTTRENPSGDVQEEAQDVSTQSGLEQEILEELQALGYIGDAKVSDPSSSARAQEEQVVQSLRALGYSGGAATMNSQGGRGFLGVYPADSDGGVRIDNLVDGSPADAGGIQAGDVILAVDDLPISSTDVLREVLASKSPGTRVKLDLARGDQHVTLNITLASQGDDDSSEEMEEIEEEPAEADVWISENEDLQQLLESELRELEGRGQWSVVPAPDAGRGFLGVMLDGLTVTDTAEGSAAQMTGIQPGETIRSIDGEGLESAEDLGGQLARRPAGAQCVLGLVGPLGERELVVTLGARPSEVEIGELAEPQEEFRVRVESAPEPEARGFLGVGLSEKDGQVIVAQVYEGTPAAEAGVQAGDRIVKLKGKGIDSVEELLEVIGKLKIGKSYALVVERNGEKVRLRTSVAQRPEVEVLQQLEPEADTYLLESETESARTERRLEQQERDILQRMEEMRRDFGQREREMQRELERVRQSLGRDREDMQRSREELQRRTLEQGVAERLLRTRERRGRVESRSGNRDVDDLRETLRSLREQIESLRGEVHSLRERLNDR